MRLDRIEIVGFKSFAEKTVFTFHPGITAIVGPNGCGKSNVVDAFKWVLGEQSAKSLRGDSMEDVIFFGSTTKKTKGMAEVTLVLSDVNGTGEEQSEGGTAILSGVVSVTRRLFRSGESEYLMNKVHCRLKDIKNMFLDTGLELKAYSILEQGKMNSILNSKPLERRFLIEEVAGVMKYKVRKAEALKKLESSKLNLQRLQDIINEVKRQINSIDRYAKKAETYKRLFEDIRDIDVRLAYRNVSRLKDDVAECTDRDNHLKTREAECSADLHSVEAAIEEKKRAFVEREKTHEEMRTRLHATEKMLAEGEGRKELMRKDCDNMRERIERLSQRDVELDGEKENAEVRIRIVTDEQTQMGESLQEMEKVLEQKSTEFAEIASIREGLEEKMEQEKRSLFNRAEEISVLKNEIKHLSTMTEQISRKTEKSFQDINKVKNEISALEGVIIETLRGIQGVEAELARKFDILNENVAVREHMKKELGKQEVALYRDREEVAALTSKLDSFREIATEQQNRLGKEVETLCQVADIIEAVPEYENAIEAVLGEKLSASVVRSSNEVSNAVQIIRDQKKHRSGLISLQHAGQAQRGPHSDRANTFSKDGVIGWAVNLVSVKDGHNSVVYSLLKDILIVDSLSTAFSLRERTLRETGSNYLHFVTPEGEVLDSSGMVFAGVMRGVLKIKRQMKELEENIASKRDLVVAGEKSIIELKRNIASNEEGIAMIEQEIALHEKNRHELNVKMTSLDEEKLRLQKNLDYLKIEKENEEKENERMKLLTIEKEEECHTLEVEKENSDCTIQNIRDEILEKKDAMERNRLQLTEVRLDITALRERMTALSNESQRLRSVIRDIGVKKEEISSECLSIEGDIRTRKEEIVKKEEELTSSVMLIDELRGSVSAMGQTIEELGNEISVLEERQKKSFVELDSIRKELSQVEIKRSESSLELKYIIEEMRRNYSIEIETYEGVQVVSQDEEEKLPKLKDKLQSIGPVSLGTLEEYEELKARYDFLKKQQDDLLNAVSSVEETIQKINRSTKQRLSEAFEALNTKFKEVFNTLFGDGRAELILTEGDILESGIEIVAQPPGKKLKNLSLLSGGEQALTALSLLFAGFMVKPTPMCLLDEVDAPLDESNTEKFTTLLTELSKKIQFITITHNRRTMEAAEFLYGITMEEPGVSNVVSMHLTEA